jgi:hypothetical protein
MTFPVVDRRRHHAQTDPGQTRVRLPRVDVVLLWEPCEDAEIAWSAGWGEQTPLESEKFLTRSENGDGRVRPEVSPAKGARVLPAILPRAAIALVRARYPDALICAQCGLLLATRPESYRTSNLTTAGRETFVCAECRQALEDIERDTEARRDNLELGRAARGRQKNPDAGRSSGVGEIPKEAPERIKSDADLQSGFSDPRTLARDAAPVRIHRGGRPRKYRTEAERRQASRGYSRSYRLHRKAIVLA